MRSETLYSVVVFATILALANPLNAQVGGTASPGGGRIVSDPPLAPGDMIRLRFWQEPELSGDFPVDERGLVTLPLLGVKQVTLWPPEQMKAQIIQEYARQLRDQPAQVTMLRRVRVIGAVRNPGLFHVDPTMSLGDLIALAGGPEAEAVQDQIRLYRGGRLLLTRLDGTAVLPGLQSGDQIVVPRRSWLARNAAVILGAALSALAILTRV
jgi:protein involved in polysaccharide export with SLBB domain